MKKIFFISLALLGAAAAQAQSLDRMVIASGGNYSTSPNAQLSFTVGELVVEYASATNGTSLSQGFQQGESAPTGINPNSLLTVKMNIFPNPFTSSIEVISAASIDKPSFQFQDVLGRITSVRATEIENGRHWKIETSSLTAGNYWLTISAGDKSSSFALVRATN